MKYRHLPSQVEGFRAYARTPAGTWNLISDGPAPAKPDQASIQIKVEQDLNRPQMAVVTDPATEKSRMIWDPNPQLRDFSLGEASVYRWTDPTGRKWIGGLYRPPGFVSGRRYPLVIQTHGFFEHEFRTSGQFPTAFAARALVGAGIVVLQVRDAEGRENTEEGPSNVRGYAAAIAQLSIDGLIDPDRVGIVGFSRTVYYAMSAITSATVRFKAASITDGVDMGYWQYLQGVDLSNNGIEHDAENLMGAAPFGPGLQVWAKHSPEFNLDKVQAPLQVVATTTEDVLSMWEPYAALRLLKKPVDLLLLNDDEHVLTNPAARLASQGGTVDWFRFWLQDYESPDPAKAEQYKRWEGLRAIQEAQDASRQAAR